MNSCGPKKPRPKKPSRGGHRPGVASHPDERSRSPPPVPTAEELQHAMSVQKILDREPNFIKHLTFLVKPLIDIEHQSERDTKQRDNSRYDDEQRDKPQMNGTRSERSPNDLMAVDEKKNRHKGMTREEIRTLCSRSGFFGWTDFLMKLSAIEQAKKGSINQQKQK